MEKGVVYLKSADLERRYDVCCKEIIKWIEALFLPAPVMLGRSMRWHFKEIEEREDVFSKIQKGIFSEKVRKAKENRVRQDWFEDRSPYEWLCQYDLASRYQLSALTMAVLIKKGVICGHSMKKGMKNLWLLAELEEFEKGFTKRKVR